MQLIDPKANWRTYATVVVGLGLGIADKAGVTVGFPWSWAIRFLGNGELIAAIRAQSGQAADDIVKVVDSVLVQVSLPAEPPSPPLPVGPTDPVVPVERSGLPPVGG